VVSHTEGRNPKAHQKVGNFGKSSESGLAKSVASHVALQDL